MREQPLSQSLRRISEIMQNYVTSTCNGVYIQLNKLCTSLHHAEYDVRRNFVSYCALGICTIFVAAVLYLYIQRYLARCAQLFTIRMCVITHEASSVWYELMSSHGPDGLPRGTQRQTQYIMHLVIGLLHEYVLMYWAVACRFSYIHRLQLQRSTVPPN